MATFGIKILYIHAHREERTENDEGHDVDVEIKKANPFCEVVWLHDRPPDNVSVLAVNERNDDDLYIERLFIRA